MTLDNETRKAIGEAFISSVDDLARECGLEKSDATMLFLDSAIGASIRFFGNAHTLEVLAAAIEVINEQRADPVNTGENIVTIDFKQGDTDAV